MGGAAAREALHPSLMVVAHLRRMPAEGFGVQYEAAFSQRSFCGVAGRELHGGYIVVDSPAPGALVTLRSGSGVRPGQLFFRRGFPTPAHGWTGKVVAKGFCAAKKEWMTDEFVPFEGTLEFKKPSSGDKECSS